MVCILANCRVEAISLAACLMRKLSNHSPMAGAIKTAIIPTMAITTANSMRVTPPTLLLFLKILKKCLLLTFLIFFQELCQDGEFITY
jgi:hypothetical protein